MIKENIYNCTKYLALCLLFVVSSVSAQDTVQRISSDYADITLISEYSQIIAGDESKLLLEVDLVENWHSYWDNPGDSGYPVNIEIIDNNDAEIIGHQSQVPEIIVFDTLVNFGYHDKFYINYDLKFNKALSKGDHKIKLRISYLVCNDICIPENIETDFLVKVSDRAIANDSYNELITKVKDVFAQKVIGNASFNIKDNSVILAIENQPKISDIDKLYFFPLTESVIQYEIGQTNNIDDKIYFKLPYDGGAGIKQLKGILSAGNENFQIIAEYDQELIFPSDVSFDFVYLLKLILYAILGGLILNLMPCVFPVLSLKCLHIASCKNKKLHEIRRSSFYYFLGIEVCFIIFAILIILLKKAGLAIGWGFHMQSAYFVGFLVLLFYMIALNLSDIFTLKSFYLSNANYKSTSEAINSFLSGALMTVVATPCTAPFMAAAVGFAFTQTNACIYLIFLAIGFGLSLPVIFISLNDTLIRLIPRPGRWLISFKQFLAFPFYLTAIWLLWIFSNLTNVDLLFIFIVTLLLLTLAIWIIGKLRSPFIKLIFLILSIVSINYFYNHLEENIDVKGGYMSSEYLYYADYSEEVLQELILQDKKIFIDVTADWCITCKFNQIRSFGTNEIIEFFNINEIYYVKADWTHYDDKITSLLAKYNRSGIPLYIYINQGKVTILPQLLSRTDIVEMVLE
jgi:DsbC/DsbD-like thiol-disulfide interchange protein/cytochrome c biogenesis protein CcdA